MKLLQRIADHARSARLPDGTRLFLRPLRASDFALAEQYFSRLSEQTRYYRFMVQTPVLTAETLERLVAALKDERAAVIVASVAHDGEDEVVGGARIVPANRHGSCEFALSVVDDWQGRGVGSALLREIVRCAGRLGYHRIEGTVLTMNTTMLKVAQQLKFHCHADPHDPGITNVTRAIVG